MRAKGCHGRAAQYLWLQVGRPSGETPIQGAQGGSFHLPALKGEGVVQAGVEWLLMTLMVLPFVAGKGLEMYEFHAQTAVFQLAALEYGSGQLADQQHGRHPQPKEPLRHGQNIAEVAKMCGGASPRTSCCGSIEILRHSHHLLPVAIWARVDAIHSFLFPPAHLQLEGGAWGLQSTAEGPVRG